MPAQRAESEIRRGLGLAAEAAKRGEAEATMRHAEAVLALDPSNQIALGMLAGVYVQLQMPDRAQACLRKVLEINPDNALARFQLGMLQFEAGQAQNALDTWAPALKDDNEFVCHFGSALALLELRKPQEARPLLEYCAPRMPRNHSFYPRLQELLEQLRP